MHPLQVPLAAGRVQASQVKAPEAHHLLDHPEHRLHDRLAPGIHGLALSGCHAMPRRAYRIGVRWQRRRLGQACRKRLVVALPVFGDEGLEVTALT